jgi:hypothetical protein
MKNKKNKNPQKAFEATIETAIDTFQTTILTAVREHTAQILLDGVDDPIVQQAGGNLFKAFKPQKLPKTSGRAAKRDRGDLVNMQDAFVDYVIKHPGMRIEEINQELSTTTKDLALPIRKAISLKLVRTEGAKRATKYYATAAGAKKNNAESTATKPKRADKAVRAKARVKKTAKKAATSKAAKATKAPKPVKVAQPAKVVQPAKVAKPRKAKAVKVVPVNHAPVIEVTPEPEATVEAA